MPYDFYSMERSDFFLMAKGFFDKRKSDSINFAKVAFWVAAIHQNGLAQKPIFENKFVSQWFGHKEKQMTKEEKQENNKKIMAQLELMQKIQDAKKQKNSELKDLN